MTIVLIRAAAWATFWGVAAAEIAEELDLPRAWRAAPIAAALAVLAVIHTHAHPGKPKDVS